VRPRIALIVVLLACIRITAVSAQCSEGTTLGYGCGDYIEQGCCGGDVLYWCENGWSCRLSCASDLYCGWVFGWQRYRCGSDGLAAPNNDPPLDCDDHDGDGYGVGGDCDDTDPTVYPGAVEMCDGIDNDCDTHLDEDFDQDHDGYGPGPPCDPPYDCDDTHDTAYPGAPEVPYDGIDQDCDGFDLSDLDEDGYDGGSDGDDCNDNDATVNPGQGEDCTDGVDNDCDGLADGADDECGGDDDDDDDDTTPVADDDDTADVPTDDDIAASPTAVEPFGFGCSCRLARAGAAGLPVLALFALALVRLVRRG